MNSVYVSKVDKNDIIGRELSYTMTKDEFNEISGDKFNPQKVIDYINENGELLGTVTEIHLEG